MLASEGALQQALPLPLPDIRSPAGAGLMLTLVLYPYVYLMTRAAFVSQSAGGAGSGAHPRCRALAAVLPGGPAAGAPGDHRRAGAGADGDPGGLRHRGLLRRPHPEHRHLPHLVRAGRRHGRRRNWPAYCCSPWWVLLTLERRARKERRISVASARAAAPLPLGRGPGLLLAAALWLPVLLGFILPALQLLVWSLPRWRDLAEPGFLGLLGTSLLIALCTALAATGLGLLLIWARRLRGDRPPPPGRRARRLRLRGAGHRAGGGRGAGARQPGPRPQQSAGVRGPAGARSAVLRHPVRGGVRLHGALPDHSHPGPGRRPAEPVPPTWTTPPARWARRRCRCCGGCICRCCGCRWPPAPCWCSWTPSRSCPPRWCCGPSTPTPWRVRAFELASDERLADAALPALTILLAGVAPVILLTRSIRNPHQESPHADH